MASYGRNFDFRVPPKSGQRSGRWVLTDSGLDNAIVGEGTSTTILPIGVPIGHDSAYVDLTNADEFTNAGSAKLIYNPTVAISGLHGILVYEHAPAAFAGNDPYLTTYSDIDTVTVGKLCQMVSGRDVKVVLTNTTSRTFLNTRAYTGRTMVAGIGVSTPTLVVGDYIGPGTGNNTAGYWVESNLANAWLVVTAVDNDRAEVEARFTF